MAGHCGEAAESDLVREAGVQDVEIPSAQRPQHCRALCSHKKKYKAEKRGRAILFGQQSSASFNSLIKLHLPGECPKTHLFN